MLSKERDLGLWEMFVSWPSPVGVIFCNCSRKRFFNDRTFSFTLTDTSALQEASLEKARGVTIKYLPDVPSKARYIQKY